MGDIITYAYIDEKQTKAIVENQLKINILE
jgi:hypothetical protein